MSENLKRLPELLAELIRREGSVSVATYMELVLGKYYKSKNPFGSGGDFITAPEISQMFGEMIGVWLIDIWEQTGKPTSIHLVELGPGNGTLAADIMRTISAWQDFKSTVTLHLVETSPRLREIQANTLKGCSVEWHNCFRDVPKGECFVIANEFFDALPIHQFQKIEGKWKERRIGYNKQKDAFFFMTGKETIDVSLLPFSPEKGISGEIFETSPVSLDLLEEISVRISKYGGTALIIDYGHDMSGFGDTLQAVSKHTYSNPLENLGEKDITAHVDFAAFRRVAEKYVSVWGPVTQGYFLRTLGIEVRAEKLWQNANDKQRKYIMTSLHRLIDSSEMGRLFKVMALTRKKATINLEGFNNEIFDD